MSTILPLSHSVPALTSTGRSLFYIATASGLGLLLASCAIPGPQSGRSASTEPVLPPRIMDTVRVSDLQGTATLQQAGRRVALKPEADIGENQPVQVGAKSSLRLSLGKRALFELGPNSRVVVHQLPRDGSGGVRATWLRLEQGYLRVLASDDRADAPIEVSFSRWAAKLEAGEYFFDSRENAASACASRGPLRLSGVPEWTPQNLQEPCVNLEARRAPVEIALREDDWAILRSKRRLQPTLAKAAKWQASHALARLEQENKKAPGRGRSVTERASLSDSASIDANPRKLGEPYGASVQTIAFLPPTPAVWEIQTPAYAVAAPAPALVFYADPPAEPLADSSEPAAATRGPAHELPTIRVDSSPAPDVAFVPPPAAVTSTISEAYVPDVPAAHSAASAYSAPAAAAIVESPTVVDEVTAGPVAAEVAVSPVVETPAPDTAHADAVATGSADSMPSLKWSHELQAGGHATPAGTIPPEPAPPFEVASYQAQDGVVAGGDSAVSESAMLAPPIESPNPDVAEWIVNVASYPSIESAEEHVQQLNAQSYAASVRHETVRGRSSYRVVIEGIPSEVAAQSAVSDLSSRLGVRTAWVLRKR